MGREGKAGRFHFTCTEEFIIVPDDLIEKLAAGKGVRNGDYISKENIFPDGYLEYLERVLNVNRKNPAFSYPYIEEEPIGERGIFTILVRQLKALKADGEKCFGEIRLIMYLNGEVRGIVVK